MTKSWKTSLFGCLAAVAAYLSNQTGLEHTIGIVLGPVCVALMGIFARDANVSSEDQGLKK